MRMLGFLFLLLLVFAGVGYFRGWFGISTSQAAGKADVTVEVNQDKMLQDAKSASTTLGQLSAQAVAAVNRLGTKVDADESVLEGTLSTVDPVARDLTLVVAGETIHVHVPIDIPVTQDGKTVAFERLQPTTRVQLAFRRTGEAHSLTRIQILP